MNEKQVFYFTYGLGSEFPFRKGWTEVRAENRRRAIEIFRLFHPDRIEGVINCADIYDEDRFKKTSMYMNGNYGVFAHELIDVFHKIVGEE